MMQAKNPTALGVSGTLLNGQLFLMRETSGGEEGGVIGIVVGDAPTVLMTSFLLLLLFGLAGTTAKSTGNRQSDRCPRSERSKGEMSRGMTVADKKAASSNNAFTPLGIHNGAPF